MTVLENSRSNWTVYGDDGKILFVTTNSKHLREYILANKKETPKNERFTS